MRVKIVLHPPCVELEMLERFNFSSSSIKGFVHLLLSVLCPLVINPETVIPQHGSLGEPRGVNNKKGNESQRETSQLLDNNEATFDSCSLRNKYRRGQRCCNKT